MNKRKVHWKNINAHFISSVFPFQNANQNNQQTLVLNYYFAFGFWPSIIWWNEAGISRKIIFLDFRFSNRLLHHGYAADTRFMLVDVCNSALQARRKMWGWWGFVPIDFWVRWNKLKSEIFGWYRIWSFFLQCFVKLETQYQSFGFKIKNEIELIVPTKFEILPTGLLLLVHESSLKLSFLSKFNQFIK